VWSLELWDSDSDDERGHGIMITLAGGMHLELYLLETGDGDGGPPDGRDDWVEWGEDGSPEALPVYRRYIGALETKDVRSFAAHLLNLIS
jgi:hypothetical protein